VSNNWGTSIILPRVSLLLVHVALDFCPQSRSLAQPPIGLYRKPRHNLSTPGPAGISEEAAYEDKHHVLTESLRMPCTLWLD
jgi:hypothetical protein